MSLQQKLSLKLQQKMVLTPTLQQAIRLLRESDRPGARGGIPRRRAPGR